ncbi:hypothetical protein GH754_06585 [Salinibacillus xinjiangensis]|uniref:Uncharacterized protein n=1 Tax=Salinibacillus xinjiangensis TaxID=1229268 RepID=A0A6G1X597_9BACI|nr:hypothetical protein [Salinibacillus xinjiangensis]
MDVTTKEWVLTKLDEKYEEVYVFEEVKDDEDKFKYESVNEKETLVRVFDGMTIDVEVEHYEGNSATIKVSAIKAPVDGVIPTYEASYKDGE